MLNSRSFSVGSQTFSFLLLEFNFDILITLERNSEIMPSMAPIIYREFLELLKDCSDPSQLFIFSNTPRTDTFYQFCTQYCGFTRPCMTLSNYPGAETRSFDRSSLNAEHILSLESNDF